MRKKVLFWLNLVLNEQFTRFLALTSFQTSAEGLSFFCEN